MRETLDRGYRYALALTADPNLAEDLVHDAWAAALHNGGAPSLAYLRVAIRNRWIDAHRRAERRERASGTMALPSTRAADEVVTDRQRVEQALGALTPAVREVLFLTAVEGFTAAEVSELTGLPRNTVLSHLHRARKRVRAAFEDEDEEVVP